MADGKSSSGIGVMGLLGVAFVVLKLTGYINWSWWWVTLPFWGGIALVLVFFAVMGIVAIAAARGKLTIKHKEPRSVEKSKWQQRLEELQAQQKAQRRTP